MAKLHVSSSSKPKNQGNNKSFKSGNSNSWWSGSGVKPSVAMAGLAALGIGGAFPLVSKVIAPTVGGIGKSFASLFGSNGSKSSSTQNDTTSGAIEKNRATAANSSINNLTKVTKKGFADVLKAMGAKEDPKKKKKSLWEMLTGALFGGGLKMPRILPVGGGGGLLKNLFKWGGIGLLSNYLGHGIRSALGIQDDNRGERVAHFIGDTISGGLAYSRGKAKYASTLNKLNRAKNIKNAQKALQTGKGIAKTGKLAMMGLRGSALVASAGTAAATFGLSLLVEEVIMQAVVDPLIHRYIRNQNKVAEQANYENFKRNGYSLSLSSPNDSIKAIQTVAAGGGTLSTMSKFWGTFTATDKDKVWMPYNDTPKEIHEQVAQLEAEASKETDITKKRKILDQRDKLYDRYYYRTDRKNANDKISVLGVKNLLDTKDDVISPESVIGLAYSLGNKGDAKEATKLVNTNKKTMGALALLMQNAAANRVMKDYNELGGWENMSSKEASKFVRRTFGYDGSYYNNALAKKGILSMKEDTLQQKADKIKNLISTGDKEYVNLGIDMLNSLSEQERLKVFASRAQKLSDDKDYFDKLGLSNNTAKNLKKQYSNIINTGYLEGGTGPNQSIAALTANALSDDLKEFSSENMVARAQNLAEEKASEGTLTHTETTDLLSAQNQLDYHIVELTSALTGKKVETAEASGNEIPQGSLSLSNNQTPVNSGSSGAFASYMQKLKNLQSPYGYGQKLGNLSLGG